MQTRPPRVAPSAWSQAQPEAGQDLLPVAQVGPADLVALLAAAPQVVALLGTTSPRNFLPQVARHFGVPPTGLAYYNMGGVAERAWILPLLEPVLPAGRGVRPEASRGYYLFLRGRAAAYHPGLYHPRFEAAMQRADRALRAAHSGQQMMVARRQLDLIAGEAAAMIIEHFDGLLVSRPAAGDLDAYAVLGVTPTASASELRAAYYNRMREVHPDTVAGLDPESQQEAHRRSQEIIRAYQQLKGQTTGSFG